MKKIYLFTLFGAAMSSLSAQQISIQESTQKRIPISADKAAKIKANKKAPTTNNAYAYFCPTDAAVCNIDPNNAGNTFATYIDPLFVDSTVTATFSGSTSHVTSMKAGGVFDITSHFFNGQNGIPFAGSATTPYDIDSVWVGGEYKMQNPACGDTLQVEISWGPAASTWYAGLQITGPPAMSWKMPKNTPSVLSGNHCFSTAPGSNSIILKHIFVVADTAVYTNPNFPYILLKPSTPITIPAGSIVGIQYTFIPKATYTFGQNYFTSPTNNSTMNSYMSYITEEKDLSATPPGTPQNYFYDASSKQTSGVLSQKARYGTYPSAQTFLNGTMGPFTNDGYLWALNAHYASTVGVNEITNSGFALGQNMPNPATNLTTINYQINKAASSMAFEIYDIRGVKVFEKTQTGVQQGKYSVELNGANYPAGIYFYSLTVDGNKITKKMVVSK